METVQSHNLAQSIRHAQRNKPNTHAQSGGDTSLPLLHHCLMLFLIRLVLQSRAGLTLSLLPLSIGPWTHCHAPRWCMKEVISLAGSTDLPWLNLTEHISFRPMSPGCTSERPGAQWCWSRSGRRSSIGSSGARPEVPGHAYEHVEAIQTTERHFEFLDLSWTLWIQSWRLITFMKWCCILPFLTHHYRCVRNSTTVFKLLL